MNKKERERAIIRGNQHDPDLASRLIKFGDKSRREAKAFKSAKAEIKRVKKRDTYYEEVEPLTELSKKTLKSYVKKAEKEDRSSQSKHKQKKRIVGQHRAGLRTLKAIPYDYKKKGGGVVEEVEPLSELSKRVLNNYSNKSYREMNQAKVGSKKFYKRLGGLNSAEDRLGGAYKTKDDKVKKYRNEEVEQNEVSMTKINEDETNENPFQVARQNYDTLIQGALSGNAVDVRNAVNDIMVTKASEVVSAIKDEVSQTMFGTEENPEDDRPKGDDDDDEWTPEDDESDDEDDDTEHPELDDDDESDDDFEDDEVEGYDDEDDDLPDDEDDTDDEESA